jgi:hypothetical protein
MALLLYSGALAQIDPNLLLGLTNATTVEMNAITGTLAGSLIYNTTDNAIYQYNGSSWNIVGQMGPAGADGPQGPQGPAGPQGIQGIPGDPATDDQILSTDGSAGNISISGGNTINLNVNDADGNPTNEIQTLSLTGSNLTISGTGGNTVSLPVLVNLATDNLTQDAETRTYDMNNQNLGFTNGKIGVGTSTPTSALSVSGSFSTAIRSSAVNTSVGVNDHTLILTAKDLVITLPAASSCMGRIYVFKNIGNGNNFTSIDYLDEKGAPENKLDKDKSFWMQSDGTNWHLINKI